VGEQTAVLYKKVRFILKHHMSNWKFKNKRGSLLLIGLFLLSCVVLAPAPHAYAAGDRGKPRQPVCNMPLVGLEPTSAGATGANGSATANWVSVTINDRTSFTVKYNTDGFSCSNDPSQNIKYILGNIDVASNISGTYTDSDTTDGDWHYQSDKSYIVHFTNKTTGNLASYSNPHIDTYSSSQIHDFLSGGELKIRTDETKVKGPDGKDSCDEAQAALDNTDFDLYFDAGRGGWRCRDNNGFAGEFDFTGVRIINTIDPATLNNYNITFGFSGGEIVPVDKHNDKGYHMKACPNLKGARGNVFGSGSCQKGNTFIELSAAQLKTLDGTGTLTLDTYNNIGDADRGSNKTHTITIGGAGNPSIAAGAGSGAETADKATCESSGFSLAWIVCPVINLMSKAVDGIYSTLIEPLLITTPLSLDTSTANYQVWSTFRIIGDIFLVIALLVVVFGQSVGGGLIDAYSAKKILPRLLAAAILINLSYYIVALSVDVSNIVGGGIRSLILTPFHLAHDEIRVGGTSAGLGVAAAAGAAGGGIWAVAAAGGAAAVIADMLPAFLLFILLPAIIVVLAILAVVIFRQGLILLLVLLSPIAFALYCLPNTEQYFRKWWDLLLKTLLVYPIIAVLFAMGNVFAITITRSPKTFGPLTALMGVIALFVPLFLVPFSFKLAGGVLGRMHDILSTGGKRFAEGVKGNPNNPFSRRNIAKDRAGGTVNRAQVQAYRNMKGGNKGRGRAPRTAALLFGSSLEKEASRNAQSKQRIFNIKDNGDDSIVNAAASFVDPKGVRRTLDSKVVKDADYRAAQMLHPTLSDKQTVADYRSTKLLSEDDSNQFASNFALMSQQSGMTIEQTQSAFMATSFARQNERGEYKHGSFKEEDGQYVFHKVGTDQASNDAFVQEQYYKRGSYEGSKMYSSFHNATAAVKQGHISNLEEIDQKRQSGGIVTKADDATYENSQVRLKQILETEKAFDMGTEVIPGDDGGQPTQLGGQQREGLQGAAAGSQAAFKRLKETGKDSAVVQRLRKEIDQGYTADTHEGQGGVAPAQPFARPQPQERPQRRTPPTSNVPPSNPSAT
jgi:hypothetical protein